MPPKQAKARSRSTRTKSTERAPSASRSTSRSRRATRRKPASETKRKRSPSPASSESEKSVHKSPSRISTRITRPSRKVAEQRQEVPSRSPSNCLPTVELSRPIHTSPRKFKVSSFMKCIQCDCSLYHFVRLALGLFFFPFMVYLVNFFVFPSDKFPGNLWGARTLLASVKWPSDCSRYFDHKVFLGMFGFILVNLLISRFVRIGQKVAVVASGRRVEYVNNGLLQLGIICLLLGSIQYRSDLIKPDSCLLQNYPALMTSMLLAALLFSVVLFLSASRSGSTRTGVFSDSGWKLVDLYLGREIRPQLFGLDLKMVVPRIGFNFMFIYSASLALYQYKENGGHFTPGLAFICCTTATTILDYFLYEHVMLNSFEMQHTGMGARFLLTSWFWLPFFSTIQTSFFFMHPQMGMKANGSSCDAVKMGIAVLIYMLGFFLNRVAMNEKFAFRSDPHNPRFSGMECISTISGKRLLAGGWWGRLRHPNYLGSVLVALSTAVPACCGQHFIWLYPALVVVGLLDRIHCTERAHSEKYGAAWQKYTQVVPSRLIPKVY